MCVLMAKIRLLCASRGFCWLGDKVSNWPHFTSLYKKAYVGRSLARYKIDYLRLNRIYLIKTNIQVDFVDFVKTRWLTLGRKRLE